MFKEVVLALLVSVAAVRCQPGRCDQIPEGATVLTPSDNKNSTFTLGIKTKIETENASYGKFLPDQTYVLILETSDPMRPFKEFMITAEDPEVDKSIYHFMHNNVDVGALKILDDDYHSRYSERCHSSVENKDNSDKNRIEIHWVSPKQSEVGQKIRFRAMVAENKEAWYTGEALTTILEKDDATPVDSPPYKPNETCNLCSEARYEVIFKGQWSRGSHSLHYPSKPDDNKYSHMVGASHDFHYVLWEQGTKASAGLKLLAEDAIITTLERDIIQNMSMTQGTRTLIRGKNHQHPNMFEPSHSLFRVDRIHHLFSVVVAMKPSPDWFLGTSRFELCTKDGWLDHYVIPMYPWDAGTMDGISYDSPRVATQTPDNVKRVAVGSFNKESPFYQMNLNDLKPFAKLEVRRLDVYPLVDEDCNDEEKSEEENEEPQAAEWRIRECPRQWGEWSSCIPDEGTCGGGARSRFRYEERVTGSQDPDDLQVKPFGNCRKLQESQYCFIDC